MKSLVRILVDQARGKPALLLMAAYWIVICVLTHWPIYGPIGLPKINDKIAHFLAYSGLSFLVTANLRFAGLALWRSCLWSVLIAMLYGALDELTQLPIPGRTGDVYDWVADCVGGLTGALALAVVAIVFQRWQRRESESK